MGYEDIRQEISNLIKLIYKNEAEVFGICEFFDISGKILLYGEPGSGKTSFAYMIANELLYSEDEVESYYLPIDKIIVSDLGRTTKNINEAFSEIKQISREKFVIIILDFLDTIDIEAKVFIIGITNIIDSLEDAFIRRFSLVKEIRADKKLLKSFVKKCNESIKMGNTILHGRENEFNKGTWKNDGRTEKAVGCCNKNRQVQVIYIQLLRKGRC